MAKINAMKLMSAKSQLGKLKSEHPQVIEFGGKIRDNAIVPGTKFTITAVTPDGKQYDTDFELTSFDADLVNGLMK
ncbi:MAG: hypothetical protein LKJ83_08200 [Eubacteriaceae bacterium]|jgi:hypothetical protein|nr:hypothetical protein [Eubacteriaceae bacterium]